MSTEVTLPALGESVTEGTVSRWLKAVGDTIEADEALLEVSTDKVDTEIPSPVAGTLLEIRVDEDETAEVGAVLAIIGDANEGGQDEAGQDEGGQDEAPAEEPAETPTPDQGSDDAAQQAAEAENPQVDGTVEEPKQDESKQDEAKPAASSGAAEGTEVTLPALGESVTEGTVSRWLKAVGDTVEADEALLEVSTDKVDTEIPSPAAGTLLEIRVQEDETAEVGAVLAIIGDANAAPAQDAPAEPEQPAEEKPAEEPKQSAEEATEQAVAPDEPEAGNEEAQKSEAPEQPKAEAPKAEAPKDDAKPAEPKAEATSQPAAARRASDGDESTYVTPLVRKLAAEHDIDLASLTGTGVGGRIRKQDVIAAAEAKKQSAAAPAQAAPAAASSTPAPSPDAGKRGTTEKMSRLRKTIATRMVESLQVSAQLTATVEVDVTAISRLRAQHKEEFKAKNGASLSYLPFITKAAVEALKAFPKVNATIDTDEGTITYAQAEHIGIAVDTEKGLLVPVIKDAGDLNISGLAKKIGDLAARTRSNKVTPDELTGGTFTITNYGSAGTLFDTPIINQPQVAILGTGALVKRPVVVEDIYGDETIAIRHMMYLSLSYDHRLVDGADAARFLSTVKSRLEEGDFASEL